MPSLRDAQLAFVAALAAPESGRDFDARIAVYRANGRSNYRNALAASYPVVKRLVGGAFFDAAVDAFVAVHPPTSGDLNVYGERFAGFLAGYAPAADLPYLPDVARLEWAIDDANRAADAKRASDAVLAALSNIAPERLPQTKLALDPSCRFARSEYPILRIWRANQPDRAGDEPIALDEGGVALVVRRDDDGVTLTPVAPGEYAWLVALAQDRTLGEAIDAAAVEDPEFDLGGALRVHIGAGTIVAVAGG